MKQFAALFSSLDQTTKTGEKVAALKEYFATADDADKVWAIALLSGRRPKRTVSAALLAEWAAAQAQLPYWLFEESYSAVGDLAETIALVLPSPAAESHESLTHWIQFVQSLETLPVEGKKERVVAAWQELSGRERFVFNKLITGGFRVGVSQQLVVKALAQATGNSEGTIAHRLMGNWQPSTIRYKELILQPEEEDRSKPYPFYLAYPLESDLHALGDPLAWQAEWKWDGIRGQVVVRKNELFVWSRGEELVTEKYPEYQELRTLLPDGTVLDGEILPFKDNQPLPFQSLQTRIGRTSVSARLLREVPVVFMAYDVLELNGEDWRAQPLSLRRQRLVELCSHESGVLKISPEVNFSNWQELATRRAEARALLSEGLMLKRKNSQYRSGRKRGDWWKWKTDPYTVDAVLIYAMSGHGRRANLFTDYTFAVWQGDELVPFTKAYSGLTDVEINEVDNWVKQNTLERFGPVRSVRAELVFEIAFEGIAESGRHKSGIALRFPRIHRWRKDKSPKEANRLADLLLLLNKK